MIPFSNTYSKLPERFFERVEPEAFEDPQLIIFNRNLAELLGINYQGVSNGRLAKVFSGQEILKGSEPIAQAYAGFQFGHPNAQLGDGRAHLLGEVAGFDIQLKGSGRTQFSRRGDGKSALGPVLREYIVSEAMYRLGVPTTRALCAVTTGENVERQDGPEPGGIFTRVASSHLRIGTMQFFAFRQDIEGVKTLLDYTIKRHYPELSEITDEREKSLAFLKVLIEKQSDLIALWSGLGFIHGVMNTDNFSLAGITIDYGPCAFMDEFRYNKVFSSIDRDGRYAFYNQAPIAKWNILRLAECLIPLIADDPNDAVKIIEEEIVPAMDIFEVKRSRIFAKKLGIDEIVKEDEKLIEIFLNYLESESLDFTLAFRNLPILFEGKDDFYPKHKMLDEFITMWKERVSDISNLNEINPIYIPRNHLIQKAIDQAYEGNYEFFHRLVDVTSNPFDLNPNHDEFTLPPTPDQRIYQTFCGT